MDPNLNVIYLDLTYSLDSRFWRINLFNHSHNLMLIHQHNAPTLRVWFGLVQYSGLVLNPKKGFAYR